MASCIILCNKGLLTGRAIAFYSDNAAVPRIMRRGSSVKNIQRLAQAANNLLLRFNVVPAFHWLSRDEQVMVIADTGSRVTDNHDYFLETFEFERLFSPGKGNLGWHTRRPAVDLFANRRNTKCPKSFFSQTYSEHCIGLDATTTTWPPGKTLYAFPPIKALTKVLTRALNSQCELFLLCPLWPSHPFFSYLTLPRRPTFPA